LIAAAIDVDVVAVIAGFVTRLPQLQVVAPDTIAAHRHSAAISETRIRIGDVAVITSLDPSFNMSITASGGAAVVKAGIGLHLIAVITVFNASSNDCIPTLGQRGAVAKTTISGFVVAIVASLVTSLPLLQIVA
jgi:hypothetical protein